LFRKAEQQGGTLIFAGTLADLKSSGCLDWWTAYKIQSRQLGPQLSLGWEKYGFVFQYRPIRDPQTQKTTAFALEGSALPVPNYEYGGGGVRFYGDESGLVLSQSNRAKVHAYLSETEMPFVFFTTLNNCLEGWNHQRPDDPSYPPDFSQAQQAQRGSCDASRIGLFQNNALIHQFYRYTYQPQADPSTGKIVHYALTAQPVNYGAPHVLSYYQDDIGKTTTTSVNRYPTGEDDTKIVQCLSAIAPPCMELWHRH